MALPVELMAAGGVRCKCTTDQDAPEASKREWKGRSGLMGWVETLENWLVVRQPCNLRTNGLMSS